MDVCDALQRLHRRREGDALKKPSVPIEKNNGSVTRSSRTKEVNSRYRSPTPSVSRRCASPNVTRTVNGSSTQSVPKRAISAERKRPSTPPTPSRPTTPVQDTSAELHSRKVTSSRLPESLWPSTMRSLSVSFQSDSISIPVSKKEKPVSHALSDRTLKPSSNVAQKQSESTSGPRKLTPERRRSPLKGKNSDQSENSRPVDGLRARLIDQHRWPSRAGGKLSSNSMTKSMDFQDKAGRSSSLALPSIGMSSLRRLSSEGISRPLHKTISDAGGIRQSLIDEIGKTAMNMKALDETVQRVSTMHKLNMNKSSDNHHSVIAAIKSCSLPGSRLPSPSKASASRGMASPSRTRPSTPTPIRGASPSRIRPSSPTRQPSSATSVLSFVSDLKKGKKSTNQLEDAHQLRLLYNRYLQWRFANAQADAALHIQKVLAEETLYNVWMATLELWDSVIMKRINLQQFRLELKLNVVLNEQLAYLEDWALLERNHCTSLAGAINDLESSTIRLPITAGARADNASLKAAISSAVDVMQAMTSSISSVFLKAEGTNCLVSELAELAAQERAILDECEATLVSTAGMQVEEYSLRAQLIQQLQGLKKNGQPVWAM
ncbi:hypothetical protein V2J09_009582 [Rumex salicifolius]